MASCIFDFIILTKEFWRREVKREDNRFFIDRTHMSFTHEDREIIAQYARSLLPEHQRENTEIDPLDLIRGDQIGMIVSFIASYINKMNMEDLHRFVGSIIGEAAGYVDTEGYMDEFSNAIQDLLVCVYRREKVKEIVRKELFPGVEEIIGGY